MLSITTRLIGDTPCLYEFRRLNQRITKKVIFTPFIFICFYIYLYLPLSFLLIEFVFLSAWIPGQRKNTSGGNIRGESAITNTQGNNIARNSKFCHHTMRIFYTLFQFKCTKGRC